MIRLYNWHLQFRMCFLSQVLSHLVRKYLFIVDPQGNSHAII